MKTKRIISVILIMLTLICTFCVNVRAEKAAPNVLSETEILPNGDRIETVLVTYSQQDGAKATKSGQKTKSYKNSSGAVMWSVTVYGTFYYNGSTASCTSATHSTTCPGSGWSIISSSASKSGNTATATATAKYTGENNSYTVTRSVSLICSANGTLS